jgi:hypothetical protein
MVPDRLPEALREVIAKFPAGALQFEVGIQTFNEETSARIKRRQNYDRLEDNLRFLRSQTGVHVHADLIAGLPGESIESFAAGFDRLVALRPQEIQVGILKRLRGTPISRHDADWQMVYGASAPYEILQNKFISFREMQRLRRFAKYWELVGNSGNFVETARLLWQDTTPFAGFMVWADWLFARMKRTDGIALVRLMELLFEFLTQERGQDATVVAAALSRDYKRGPRRDTPAFLAPYQASVEESQCPIRQRGGPKRQARHAAA